ncbi:beta-ketoacyl-[acyl-carrier-protein] synthase family protein [Micromonospora sp. NPDC003197]
MTGFAAAVTGIGLADPAGIGVERSWATLRTGRSAAAVDPDLAGNPVGISCRVPGFDAAELLGARRARLLDRSAQLALVAARQAVTAAGLDPDGWDGARVAVVLGTAGGGIGTVEEQHPQLRQNPEWVSPMLLPMYLPNMLAGQMSMEFGATGLSTVVATACASGATAIGMARSLLAADVCDVVLTGGSDALVTPLMMAGFARMGALSRRTDPCTASRPFDAERDGFVAAEGAGILVLERAADARARGVTPIGFVVGYGATTDAHHVTRPHPQGRGIEAAVRQALADAEVSPDAVEHVNAHGTSTPLNDLVEAQMLARVFPHGPLVTSTKGVTGHLLGAAGAVEAIYTLLTLRDGVVPPTANLDRPGEEIELDIAREATRRSVQLALSNSFGFGGHNAVLALAAA